MLFFAFFLSQALATPRVLPEIFYSTRAEQARHCSSAEAQTISHWSALMGQQFDKELNRLELRGLKQDVYRNQLVTLSYLNLFEQSGSLMGYVYANASHHLGRLVRDAYWSELSTTEARDLARADRALIRRVYQEPSISFRDNLRLFPNPFEENSKPGSLFKI